MKINILACIVLSVLLLSSCSQRIIDFTLISSKNIEFSKFDTYERVNSRTTGKDTKSIIFVVPTGNPSGKEAMDEAIESVPGCVALVDGVLTHKWFYIPYIYGEFTFIIEGTPIVDPALVSTMSNDLENYSVCVLDKRGNIETTIALSENDYEEIKIDLLKNPSRYKKILKAQDN